MTTINPLGISSMMEKLRGYMSASEVIKELCLLVAWAVWYRDEHGAELKSEGLESSFREAEIHYETDLFSDSLLFKKLPFPIIDELIVEVDDLAFRAKNEPSATALALLKQCQANSNETDLLTTELLGKLLVDAIGRNHSDVALYSENSLTALCQLENPQTAIFYVSRITSIPLAVTSLMGCRLVKSSKEGQFKYVGDNSPTLISAPPIGLWIETHQLREGDEILTRNIRSEDGALEKAVAEVEECGVLLLPLSVLFSRSTSGIRKTLVDKNWLHTLVHVPERQLVNTMIPSVCMVIDKRRKPEDRVAFVEVPSAEFRLFVENRYIEDVHGESPCYGTTLVETDYIKKQNYDLSFGRYKQNHVLEAMEEKKAKSITLDGVAEIIRAQAVKGEESSQDTEGVFLEVSWRDISEAGIVTEPQKCIELDEKNQRRAEKQRLQPGDILLAVKGNLGNIAIIPEGCGNNWIAGQAFVIIRPRQAIVSSAFLYRYLSSNLIQAYLATRATGSAMKVIKAGDLSDLPIELPTPEKAKSVEENYRAIQDEYNAILQHQTEINRLMEEFWPVPDE